MAAPMAQLDHVANDEEIRGYWRGWLAGAQASPYLSRGLPLPDADAAAEGHFFRRDPAELVRLWSDFAFSERPDLVKFHSPATDQEIYAFWDRNYSPDYVALKGGVPMDDLPRAQAAAYFATDGSRISTLWRTWVETKHPEDEGNIDRLLGVASDAYDSARGTVESAGRSLADLGAKLASGAQGAYQQAVTFIQGMSPDHVIELFKQNFGAIIQKIGGAVQANFRTLTYEGKEYAWEDAKQSPGTAIWYIAALAKTDATKAKKHLFDELSPSHGVDMAPVAYADMVFGFEPITITLIVLAVIVLAAVLIKKFSPPHTIASKIADVVIPAAKGAQKVLGGGGGDDGTESEDKTTTDTMSSSDPDAEKAAKAIAAARKKERDMLIVLAVVAALVAAYAAGFFDDLIGEYF